MNEKERQMDVIDMPNKNDIDNKNNYAPIFVIMGKSASGKDTVYSLIKRHIRDVKTNDRDFELVPIVTFTTRPIRDGEINGREYHFIDDNDINDAMVNGDVIDIRSYDTVYGIWHYALFASEFPKFIPSILINTPEGVKHLKTAFGDRIKTILLHVDDGERLARALSRERKQDNPKYAEMCRRFLSDESDFYKAEDFADLVINNDDPMKTADKIMHWIESSIDEWRDFMYNIK